MSKRPAGGKFSALSLIKKGLSGGDWPKVWRQHELKDSYDVVIIGGGLHGLATAHYLAENHGITNVAVLEKAYIGGGGSGRNTAIIRSNYLTPEGVAFYNRSIHLFEHLSSRPQYERYVRTARPHDARAQRCIASHDALAGGSQQGPEDRL